MERIGDRAILYYVPYTDIPIPLGGVNVLTVLNTVVVLAALLLILWAWSRRRAAVPGRGQMLMELYVSGFDDLIAGSLELETQERNRRFFPLIASLFVFLLLSNFMSFLPSHFFEEPTADINTTLALGIMAMVVATYCGIRSKGAIGYGEELLGPMWTQPGVAGKLSSIFFLPLNLIGELAKVVSISFRLFGNIMGGAIIIVVVSHLTYNMFMPIGLFLFFVFFVGAVQAFVFTMLTLTYSAVAIK